VKIRADEHVSEQIVRAVREIALSKDWYLSHVVEAGYGGAADEHWATAFAREGGEAILTADTDFHKRHAQMAAIAQTGLKVIHMPPAWAQSRGDLQAAHIFQWWRRIENKLVSMRRRECYQPPWNINEKGELKKVQMDFQNAIKKQKRKKKRQLGS